MYSRSDEKNGHPTKAPSNSFGCQHMAINEMKAMSKEDFEY